jgi:hypothetical protein
MAPFTHSRLRDLAVRCIELQRVEERDVAAMARAVAEGGFITRGEAEDLMRIERDVALTCDGWRDFFVVTLVAHLVWECRPVGRVAPADVVWLAGQLDQPRPGAAAALGEFMVELVREACDSADALVELAFAENRAPRARAPREDISARAA